MTIDAPAEEIHAVVNRFREWPSWTAWNTERFPDLKMTYDGPAEGVGARDIAKRVKVHEFRVRKAISHADRYSQEELDSALTRLASLDAALKGASRLSNTHELTRALVELTEPAKAPA